MKSNKSMIAFAAAAAFAALAAASPAASAQGGGAAAPPAATTMAPTTPAPTAPAVPMSMAVPKPSPMLDQLKYLAGSWRCAGTGYSEGKGHPTEATVKAAWDLNGFFLGLRYEEQKTAANPMPVTAVEHLGYSDELKKLVTGQVDSTGGYGTQASAGWESATMVWTGNYHLMGMQMPSRDTFVKKSENSLTHLGEVQMNGAWSKLDEETCYRLIDK
jgi:hypothetical protein